MEVTIPAISSMVMNLSWMVPWFRKMPKLTIPLLSGTPVGNVLDRKQPSSNTFIARKLVVAVMQLPKLDRQEPHQE